MSVTANRVKEDRAHFECGDMGIQALERIAELSEENLRRNEISWKQASALFMNYVNTKVLLDATPGITLGLAPNYTFTLTATKDVLDRAVQEVIAVFTLLGVPVVLSPKGYLPPQSLVRHVTERPPAPSELSR